MPKTVRILGTHGVPANYGGFETAAENVALYLAEQGWRVVVYCQEDGRGPLREDTWNGLDRVIIPIDTPGWRGTSRFDFISIRHAARYRDLCLTFGYNTAGFNAWQRIKGIPLVINMDGIEWSRAKWGPVLKSVLYVNERIACRVGNHLIADHPEIEKHLLTRVPRRKISMIAYGAHEVTEAPESIPEEFGLEPGRYLTLIGRSIPENSVVELVRGFSARQRGVRLAVLGDYTAGGSQYQDAVLDAAGPEVDFLGSIYEQKTVSALRLHCALYLHGHTVGGTNPSLVEALAAGNPVLAHDNKYNRWTAGQQAAAFFRTAQDVSDRLDELLADPGRLAGMSAASRQRYRAEFTWERVARHYEKVLSKHLPKAPDD